MSPLTASGETTPEGARFTVSDMTACSTDLLHLWLRVARHMVGDLELEIARRARTATAAAPEPERAIGLDEACVLLGMEKSYLERREHWQRLGGYKDVDGHPKFSLSTLQAHIQRLRPSSASASASTQLRA